MAATIPRADNREEVRMLVLSVGCSEAARLTGIPLNTVLSWSARGKWLQPEKPKLPPHVAAAKAGAIAAIKPADSLANKLAEDGEATKLAGMEYAKLVVSGAAARAKSDPDNALGVASDVKSALQSAAIAGGWQQAGVQVGVAINLGRGGME